MEVKQSTGFKTRCFIMLVAAAIFVFSCSCIKKENAKTAGNAEVKTVKAEKIYFDRNYQFAGTVGFKAFVNGAGQKVTVPVLKFDDKVVVYNEDDNNVKFDIKEIQITSAKIKLDKSLSGKKVVVYGAISEPGAGINQLGPFNLLVLEFVKSK